MSCKFHSKHEPVKAGQIIRSRKDLERLLVGSIVKTMQGFAMQRFVHGWAKAGSSRCKQTAEMDLTYILPARVLYIGDIVVHSIDCTCEKAGK